MKQERHVLVIFPHPDDEAFGVSGTMASHIERGTLVTYACLTLGEQGRNLGNPPFATRETLPKIRKKELEKAAKSIGLTDLRMMGYRDKTLEFLPDEELTNLVYNLIEEIQPSLIISFYPGYSVHPDHEATGRAVVRAVRKFPEEKRPNLHCVAFSKNCEQELGPPDIIHDVSHVWEKKFGALKAHISQTAWLIHDIERKLAEGQTEAIEHFKTERFWTYQWDKDKVK